MQPKTARSEKEIGSQIAAWVWINGYGDTFFNLLGEAAAKVLCDKAFETVAKLWMQMLDEDDRLKLSSASTIPKALLLFVEISGRTSLLEWSENIELKERSDGLCIAIRGCSRIDRCRKIAESRDELRNLPCPRIGCSRALLSQLTGEIYSYTLESIDAGNGICKGILARRSKAEGFPIYETSV